MSFLAGCNLFFLVGFSPILQRILIYFKATQHASKEDVFWNNSALFKLNEHFVILKMNEYVECFTCFPNRPHNFSAELKEAALRERWLWSKNNILQCIFVSKVVYTGVGKWYVCKNSVEQATFFQYSNYCLIGASRKTAFQWQ